MESTLSTSHPSLPKRTSIEYLPAEIKIEILCLLPDLESLRDVVKASPGFHSIYQFDRRRILARLLTRTTPLAILAEVASLPVLRRSSDRGSLKGTEEVGILGFAKSFLNIYDELCCFFRNSVGDGRDMKKNVGTDADVERGIKEEIKNRSVNGVNFTYSKDNGLSAQFCALSLDELLVVVRQHFIVHAISEDFSMSCLRLNPFTGKRYENGTGTGGGDEIFPLSEAESYRIRRALYRVEMLGFMHTVWHMNDPNYYITFLKSLPPWEVEEIHCIRNYMYQIYLTSRPETNRSSNKSVIDGQERAANRARVRSRIRGRASGIGVGIGGPDLEDDVDFDLAVDDQREQYLTRGLEFLWQWFHLSDQVKPCPVMKAKVKTGTNGNKTMKISQQRMVNPATWVIESHSTNASFFLTRALNPSVTGYFWPIIERSEKLISDADWSRANLGWEWLHKKNSKYLCQMHNYYNRKWGYVFWDQGRLTQMGLTEEMRWEYAPFVD
ncbi:hypothetical protein I7I51_00151 [Histoplasma capsulatum]|uniref:F-box domain-containing protein n=1 Tax=Ajellomyces capsulatus TaxID=5037 RepID=A0A8A1MEN5_AJECA|nr:hypothetical protein I7I51_00151 [Histoplasma capsulatum]